jgi:hypothetical protein
VYRKLGESLVELLIAQTKKVLDSVVRLLLGDTHVAVYLDEVTLDPETLLVAERYAVVRPTIDISMLWLHRSR